MAGEPTMPGLKTLIVEDEAIIAMMLKRDLTGLGCAVVACCVSGEDALVKDAEFAPDLVIMDIKLAGDLDGIETARRITSRHKVSLIFASAFPSEELKSAMADLGIVAVLSKPVLRQQLEPIVAGLR